MIVFDNNTTGAVTNGGTGAPSSGSTENWTVSTTTFPSSLNSGQYYHVADPALPTEKVRVTSISGSGPYVWGVTRGDENTTPVAHSSGFTVQQVVTAGDFSLIGTGLAPTGDTTGASDTANIQALLNLTGFSPLGPGTFWINQTLQCSSGTTLTGCGMGITTIKAIANYAATQVGTNPGMVMVCTSGNSAASKIRVTDLTLDMNVANISSLPGYASGAQSSPLGLENVTGLIIERVEVINSIGYCVYPIACTDLKILHCRIISGQGATTVGINQDGLHVRDSSDVVLEGNYIDTGTNAGGGDDAIAIQAISANVVNISVTGNTIVNSAANGLGIYLGGSNISRVSVTGNTFANTNNSGLIVKMGTYAAGTLLSGLAVCGNVFQNICTSGSGVGLSLQDATGVGHTATAIWQDVSIVGNTFSQYTNATAFGLYAVSGSVLQLEGNTFDAWNSLDGIRIGDHASTAPQPVTGAQVVGNTVDMATSTATSPKGIMVAETSDAVVCGNTVIGPGTTVTGGIGIQINGLGGTVTGNTVTGNRVTAWAAGISETANGSTPDYSCIVGNNCHNNAAFVTTTGSHTTAATNVIV